MAKKHLSGTELIKEAQETKVKKFTDAYWKLCTEHKLQIVQSPLSVVEFVPPVPQMATQTNEETKQEITS